MRLAVLLLGPFLLTGCAGPFGCSDDATFIEWRQPGLFDDIVAADRGTFQREDVMSGWNQSDLDQEFPREYGLHSITVTRENYTFTIRSDGSWILVAIPPEDYHALAAELMPIARTVISNEAMGVREGEEADMRFLVDSMVWSLSPPDSMSSVDVPPGRWVGGVYVGAPYDVGWIKAGPVDWEAGGFGFGKAQGTGLWDNITIALDVLRHQSDGAHVEVDAYDRATARITDGGISSSWDDQLEDVLEDAGAEAKVSGARTQPTTDPDACD